MHEAEDDLRRAEIGLVRSFVSPGERVLEVGAGGGLQAEILRSWGARVVGVDLPGRDRAAAADVPLVDYDGVALPFPADAFDLVYSSNVLEHVVDLPALSDEMARVLRPGAVAVHVVPSATWRVATLATHHPHYVRQAWRVLRHDERVAGVGAAPGEPVGGTNRSTAPRAADPLAVRVHRALVPPPHGEFPSAWSEVHGYRAAEWRDRFARDGWEVLEQRSAGLFYTGYGLVPSLGMRSRARLARLFGAACLVFVVRPMR